MATRLYLSNRAPNTNLQGPALGGWSDGDTDGRSSNRGNGFWTLLAAASKTNGGTAVVSTEFGASLTKEDDQPIYGIRFVTPPLEAVTLSGTLNLCLKASHGAGTGDEAAYMVYAYISAGDTLSQRTVLLNNYVDAAQFATTATWTQFTTPQAIAGAVQAGDRIVIEVGAVCSPATSPVGDNLYIFRWGTTDATNTPYSDATPGGTGTGAAWIDFTDTLTPQAAPSAPANDACADAISITSVPYVSSTIDTTTSTDTERGVWWTYTPSSTGRVFASTMGSNYSVRLDVFTGGCGGLTPVVGPWTSAQRVAWLGDSQTVIFWDAVASTQYWIRVRNYSAVTGPTSTVTATESGGSLVLSVYPYSAPAIDDLFIACQHIACVRNGQIVNLNENFYGNTPTAVAIDYTLRPMDDLNGGTNTALRLYVALFGSGPIVEIFDLATLNSDEDEIDYILDAIDTGGENLSSMVFDQAGNIFLGWYGDEYSVLGGIPSSEASSAVRYLDATHADNQAGAPWPVADEWPVLLQSQGSDFGDLAADQDTLFYTSAGTQILTVSMSTGVQGPTYATVPNAPGPRPGLRGLRVLPPGDGSNGVLVTAGSVVYWVGPTGSILQTYNPSPSSQFQDMDKLEITNNGQTFWVSDQYSTGLLQFDITSGNQLQYIPLNFPAGQLSGFCIYGGYRSSTGTNGGGETPTPPVEPSPYLGFETTLPIRWVRVTPTVTQENNRIFVPMTELDCQVGVGNASGEEHETNPLVMIEQSTDGGYTWGTQRTITMGRIGKYDTLLREYRWDAGRRQTFRLSGSAPVPVVLTDFYITAEPGSH